MQVFKSYKHWILFFVAGAERKIRANDSAFNSQFNYAVSSILACDMIADFFFNNYLRNIIYYVSVDIWKNKIKVSSN